MEEERGFHIGRGEYTLVYLFKCHGSIIHLIKVPRINERELSIDMTKVERVRERERDRLRSRFPAFV